MSSYNELVLDTNVLQEAGSKLSQIAGAFDTADSQADRVGGLVGHDGLRSVIKEFATNWDDKRRKLKEVVSSLSTAATQIGNTFEEVDKQLADAVAMDDASQGTTTNTSSSTSSADSAKTTDSNGSTSTGSTGTTGSTDSSGSTGTTGSSGSTGSGDSTDSTNSQGTGTDSVDGQRQTSAVTSWAQTLIAPGATHGTQVLDADGGWPGQCVDVAKDYAKSLFGGREGLNAAFPPYGQFNGNQAWTNASDDYFTRIDAAQPPAAGDIICFAATPSNSAGHVAVIESVGEDGSIHVIEANGLLSPVQPPYRTVISGSMLRTLQGYLRPNPDKIVQF